MSIMSIKLIRHKIVQTVYKMNKIAFFITTLFAIGGFAFAQALPAFAADTVGGQKLLNKVNQLQTREQNQASHSANKSGTELQNIITRADALIMNRLDSLNALLTRVQNDARLSASEKSSLITEIQKDISGLTALKAKIDADIDAKTARADAKTIITNYYVYAVFEPKTRLLVTLNNLQTTTGYVQALIPQLQNLINSLKSQGKDTSKIQPLLDDISSQVKTINTTLATDITTVQNISTTTKRNPADFSKVRQDIAQVVRSGFAKIRSDFAKMRPAFNDLVGTPKPTLSANVTCMPRPACLDATPRCLIAEPAQGWCPATPTATTETPSTSTSPSPTQ
jgi:hypothetical protein